MSGFTRTFNDEELRVRAFLGWSVGQLLLGTVANPANLVLFNPAAGALTVIFTKLLVSSAVANSYTLFLLGADPALAAGNTPTSRGGISFAGKVIVESAVAAAPAQIGVYAAGTLAAGQQVDLLAGEVYTVFRGGGFLIQFPALAGNVCMSASWYELPQ